jgi:hypothetical protein
LCQGNRGIEVIVVSDRPARRNWRKHLGTNRNSNRGIEVKRRPAHIELHYGKDGRQQLQLYVPQLKWRGFGGPADCGNFWTARRWMRLARTERPHPGGAMNSMAPLRLRCSVRAYYLAPLRYSRPESELDTKHSWELWQPRWKRDPKSTRAEQCLGDLCTGPENRKLDSPARKIEPIPAVYPH